MPSAVTRGVKTAREIGLNREGRQEREGNEAKIGAILRLITRVHSFQIGQFSWPSLRSLRFLQRMWSFGELSL